MLQGGDSFLRVSDRRWKGGLLSGAFIGQFRIIRALLKILSEHKMIGQDAVVTVKVVLIQLFNGFADLLMKRFLSIGQYRVIDDLDG